MDEHEGQQETNAYLIDVDTQLVANAKQELPYVETAFEQLMLRYERLLYRVCRGLLSRPDDAEEVVQEVMIKVFHNIASFEGRSKFKTWLLQIARRECYTHYHKNKKHQNLSDISNVAGSEAEQAPYTSTELKSVETKMELEKILSAIHIDDRQILTLRFIAELDLSEISDVLEIRLSATKMRLYRALDRAKVIAETQ